MSVGSKAVKIAESHSFCVAVKPKLGLGRLSVKVSRSHTHTHTHTHTRQDSSERVISPSQRPLPTQHTRDKRGEHLCPQRGSNKQS